MKLLVAILLTVLLAYTAYLFHDVIPWWGFSIGALLAGWVVPQRAWLSWLSGFMGMLICWGIICWYINSQNHGLMAERMAEILGLKFSSLLMIVVTALVGAIIGGFASLTGAFLRKRPVLVEKQKN